MSEQVFNKFLLEKACQKFSLWNRFRLLFCPMSWSYDSGCLVKFKTLDGHIFIMNITYKDEL